MSEISIIAIACVSGIPLTALIVGLVCRDMYRVSLKHIEESQMVGGTPRAVYDAKAELALAKQKNVQAAKASRIPMSKVVS